MLVIVSKLTNQSSGRVWATGLTVCCSSCAAAGWRIWTKQQKHPQWKQTKSQNKSKLPEDQTSVFICSAGGFYHWRAEQVIFTWSGFIMLALFMSRSYLHLAAVNFSIWWLLCYINFYFCSLFTLTTSL